MFDRSRYFWMIKDINDVTCHFKRQELASYLAGHDEIEKALDSMDVMSVKAWTVRYYAVRSNMCTQGLCITSAPIFIFSINKSI